jgi:hypothetical protein
VATNPERFLTATLGGAAGYWNWKPEYDRSAEAHAVELEGEVPFRGLVVILLTVASFSPLFSSLCAGAHAAIMEIGDDKA